MKQFVIKFGFFALIFFILNGSILAQPTFSGNLRTGDLLFQNLDCGPMCDAIEAVTVGWNKMPFSHVGVVEKNADKIFVWESTSPGVRRVPLDSFKMRSANALLVGRLKNQYAKLIPNAIKFFKEKEGVMYDDAFLYDNGKYYCSELVYDAFKTANNNKPFFSLFPMTFKKPGSNSYFPVWIAYYKKLGMEIPEGKPGCNPGGLSRSGKLKILGVF